LYYKDYTARSIRGKVSQNIHPICSPNPFVGQDKMARALKIYFMFLSTLPWKTP